jgi:hypothetical protein
MGMLEYIFVMSSVANLEVWIKGVCFNSRINSVEFFMLKVYGNQTNCLIFSGRSFDNLIAGALRQLTTGGWVGLLYVISQDLLQLVLRDSNW